jgi:hypothetical protein
MPHLVKRKKYSTYEQQGPNPQDALLEQEVNTPLREAVCWDQDYISD